MEGGGGGSAGGGGVFSAAREPREQLQRREVAEEEKGAAAAAADGKVVAGTGGGMKFRLSARAPHGVGALLLIGGAAVVGAAVVAWRRSRRGNKGADHQRDRQPAKREVFDGGFVEDGKVQGMALVQKLDQSNEKLIAGNADIGSRSLDGKATEESQQIHKDNDIVADQLDTKPEEKLDQDSGSDPVEVNLDDTDKEHVDKVDQNSSINHAEITTHDVFQDNEHIEKIGNVKRTDQNLSPNPVEILMQEVITVCLVPGNFEKVDEDSSKNYIENEIALEDNKDMEANDQRKLSINGPVIIFNKRNDEIDDVQEAESMENTPTAHQMHDEELLDDMVTDTDIVTETEESKQGERTITEETELKQDEKKALAGLIELASSPAVSSLVKPAEKKGPEFPGRNETGMKTEQDYTNGELREHGLMSKGGGMQGGAIATMDRRSPAMAILALVFALTIGMTIIVRLYAPPRATKLQMDL